MVWYIAHRLLTPVLPHRAPCEMGGHIAMGGCHGSIGGVGVGGCGYNGGWSWAMFVDKTLLVECL